MENGRWKRILRWLPVVFALGILVWLAVRPEVVEAEFTRVVRAEFTEVLRSEGYLRSRKRYTVTAFADGDLSRMDRKVGDPVRAGERIASLIWDVRPEPVVAPIRGVVSRVFREAAGPVRRGEPILEVVDPRDLEAVVELLTTEAARVRPGMRVTVEALALNRTFTGRVAAVSRAGFVKVSALGVEEERTEVRIRLLESVPADLGGNEFHLEAAIEVSRIDSALVIPMGAVFRAGEDWAVYRRENGFARKTVFLPGIRSEGRQVVLSGLREGEEVILFPSDQVRDGTRIRPRKVDQTEGLP